MITGLGFGLMYMPAMDIVELYFSENLGVAMGLASAGSGLGQFVVAPIIQKINKSLGLQVFAVCVQRT